MAQRKLRHHATPDFRHRVPVPVPAGAEVEQQLWALRSPSWLAPRLVELRRVLKPAPRLPERAPRSAAERYGRASYRWRDAGS